MPESVERFQERLDLQTKLEDHVDFIVDSDMPAQIKMVDLLGVIAKQLIEQNFNLVTIRKELEDHTLALDTMSDS